ncbi:MAG: 23S rRNA (guanosine(2251)-2'-O)-methyltransferase RlmB [Dehalococcoidales bacterium]|nr:23S rRNA (guanosine(2251)-2'-O)-methyltransferase RlmB [Dehalococcoidales bacterium]
MSEIIEGRNSVNEALKAGRPINKILLNRNIKSHSTVAEILHLSKARNIPVEYVDGYIIDRQSLAGANQGVIAYAAAKEYINLDTLITISREKGEPPLYCVLDGIEDPQNLGAILRTAEATGVHGVVIRSRRAVGLTSAVGKASAGAIEYIPVTRVVNISQAIETLKKEGVWVVGIDMVGELNYTEVNFRLPTAIVIGSEGRGLSVLVRKRCDSVAFIPMKGKITSLNAATAAAVVMYEAFKQRASSSVKS